MVKKLLAAAATAMLALTGFASEASAANYTLFIHGRTGGTPYLGSYWQNGSGGNQMTGVNAVAVNYDGGAHLWTSNATVVAYLNSYCTGGNACYVVCHSNGCAEIGYAVDKHSNGADQPWGRWNIYNVYGGGSAAGGSELAGNFAYFWTGLNLDLDLPVGTMRGLYNHDSVGNQIIGYVHTSQGSDYASVTDWLFPGWDDSAVAFHSSGHYRSSSNYYGAPGSGQAWNYTISDFVDYHVQPHWYSVSSGTKGHCVAGSGFCYEGDTGGIMGPVTANVANVAH